MFSQRSVSDTFEGWNTSCRQILAACVLNVWIKPWTLEAEQVAFSPFLTSSYLPFLRQVAADLWETGLLGILAVVVCGMSCLWDETRKQGNVKELEPQRPVGLHREAGAYPVRSLAWRRSAARQKEALCEPSGQCLQAKRDSTVVLWQSAQLKPIKQLKDVLVYLFAPWDLH